jgi:hypothetical protein
MANLRANRITSTEVFETTGSVQFDGSGDYLETNLDAFGTSDFTIEYWVYPKSISGSYVGTVRLQASTAAKRIEQAFQSNELQVYTDTGSWRSTGYSPSVNQWTHFALVKYSNNLTMYANGNSIWTVSNTRDYDESFAVDIGSHVDQLNGHMSNVRIVKSALYTANFTPPTRELEVIPNTVLLVCQSTTKADEEKTGKTITVNGNAVANELTPGLLTNVVKSGGSSAITGSVEFDGTGDYLQITEENDFDLGADDFTIEYWYNEGNDDRTERRTLYLRDSGTGSFLVGHTNDNSGRIFFQPRDSAGNTLGGSALVTGDASNPTGKRNYWRHYAVCRDGATARCFLDGVLQNSLSYGTTAIRDDHNNLYIGHDPVTAGRNFRGFISNLRIIKGTALYTSNFIPPTRNLTKLPGTVLLCCQDSNDPTTEATGKTITANGDPTASNFTPSVGSDGSVEFAGPTTINTENYFYLPTGDTESRTLNVATQASSSARGVFMGGLDSAPTGAERDVIDYITISSAGNAVDFGNLTAVRRLGGACSSTTRGISLGGFNAPVVKNEIEYITISSTGDAKDFGDLITTTRSNGGLANSTRGICIGGVTPSTVNNIEYVTIASTGNAQDFGDLVSVSAQSYGTASPTRGVIGGGETPSLTNTIQYVTIATMGNALDFGDLSAPRSGIVAFSNSTRGCFAGGEESPGFVNTIEYVTISTTANALNFGDLNNTNGLRLGGSASSPTRGIYASGGNNTPVSNTSLPLIHMVTINSTGDSIDFGDITVARFQIMNGTVSSGHGGLG